MVIHANKNTTKDDIDRVLSENMLNQRYIPSNMGKPFDAVKFQGMLKQGLDGVTFQKDVRNEWE